MSELTINSVLNSFLCSLTLKPDIQTYNNCWHTQFAFILIHNVWMRHLHDYNSVTPRGTCQHVLLLHHSLFSTTASPLLTTLFSAFQRALVCQSRRVNEKNKGRRRTMFSGVSKNRRLSKTTDTRTGSWCLQQQGSIRSYALSLRAVVVAAIIQ